MKDLELYLNEVGKRIMERRKKLGMTQQCHLLNIFYH